MAICHSFIRATVTILKPLGILRLLLLPSLRASAKQSSGVSEVLLDCPCHTSFALAMTGVRSSKWFRSASGFILTVMLFQLLFFSALCVYALEGYVVHVRLADNYLNFYEKTVELENKIIQVKQPMQLIASLPCLSAQFYQITVQSQSLKITKIIAVPYEGECKGRVVVIRYGIQAVYSVVLAKAGIQG